jgi:hypothetical protein
MTKPRCTICGKACQTTVDSAGCDTGRSQWGRHVYGLFSEPRCSQTCAGKPVVDIDAQRQLERMGHIVVAYRIEHGI